MNREQQRAFFAKTKILNPKKLTKRHYKTYNKDGIGGLQISAKTKKEAKKIAVDQWGNGAKIESDDYSDLYAMYGGDESKVHLHLGMIPNGAGGSSSADALGLKLQKSGIYAKPSNLSKGGFIDPHTT
jgi:hypothetical protein